MSNNKHILIVDDEPDMVEWLTSFFEDNGYKTSFAHDGFDGFEKTLAEKPDLITLDISMDKESGIKMYRKLHDSEETNKIPVIIISGVSPELKGFIERRKQVDPPAGYFEKPVDKDKLLETVKRLIG
ncbi:MAG: response regulator [candidate division Zixibacteria bacterium HGW-Zixibacteria-1]|nr:MAG: response regulator [candidate division Zixibacteria bacterium HGW-Zixibacteria-1]